MKYCCEYVRGLRYKLWILVIPVELPTYIFGNNQSVLVNSSKPHSSLKKKSSSIVFHFFCEGAAKDEWWVAYLNKNYNPADMATKSLDGGDLDAVFHIFAFLKPKYNVVIVFDSTEPEIDINK